MVSHQLINKSGVETSFYHFWMYFFFTTTLALQTLCCSPLFLVFLVFKLRLNNCWATPWLFPYWLCTWLPYTLVASYRLAPPCPICSRTSWKQHRQFHSVIYYFTKLLCWEHYLAPYPHTDTHTHTLTHTHTHTHTLTHSQVELHFQLLSPMVREMLKQSNAS